MVGRQAAALGLPHAILTWESGESRRSEPASAGAGRALRSHGSLLPRARYSGARHRASSRRPGGDLLDAAEARQRARWPGRDSRAWRMGGDRRAASSARCAEGAPRCHAARGRHAFCLRPEQSRSAFRARARAAKPGRAVAAWIDARGAGAFGAALAAGARGAGRRGARLPCRAQRDERGGLCIDRHGRRWQRRRKRSRCGLWRD